MVWNTDICHPSGLICEDISGSSYTRVTPGHLLILRPGVLSEALFVDLEVLFHLAMLLNQHRVIPLLLFAMRG